MFLGSQLDEVILNSILYDEHSYEENVLEDTEMFPAWTKLEEEEILLQDGSTETRDVEFKHILFAHVNDHLLYGDYNMSRYSTDTDRNPSHLKKIYIK